MSKLPRFIPRIRVEGDPEIARLQAEVERLTAELAIATAFNEANRGETVAMYGTVDAVFPEIPPEHVCTCTRRLDGWPTEDGWYWYHPKRLEYPYPIFVRDYEARLPPGHYLSVKRIVGTWYGPICEPGKG